MNIGVIGHVCIDHNEVENSKYQSAGSPAVFMNKIFSQLPGVKLKIFSYYGRDFTKYLAGIDIYPKEPKFENTLQYQNIVKTGSRRKQYAKHRNSSPLVDLDNEMISALSELDVCIVAPLLPNYSSTDIARTLNQLPEKCLKVLLPQGYFRDFDKSDHVVFREFMEAEEIIKYFDFVILSEEDYPDVTSLSKRWIQNTNTSVIITKGPDGAFYRSHNSGGIVPTEKVDEIIDSTGSGDIFSASFTYAYLKSGSIVNSIHFANRIAGYCLRFTPDQLDITGVAEQNNFLLISKNKLKISNLSKVLNIKSHFRK